MRESPSLWSELGADTVVFKERTLDEGQLEYLGYYLTKAPADGKRRRRDLVNEGRWQLYPVKKTMRPGQQLRLMEILSQLEFTDLVWGVGAGSAIRLAWKRLLTKWNDDRCALQRYPLEKHFDLAAFWVDMEARSRNESGLRHPLRLLGPRPQPIKSEPLPRHSGERFWPSKPQQAAVRRTRPQSTLRDAILDMRQDNSLNDL